MIKTNMYGVKNMSEAFIPLIEPAGGRIVNLGSGAGPMYVAKQDKDVQALLSTESPTWDQLETFMKETCANSATNAFGVYGCTKAVMAKYT